MTKLLIIGYIWPELQRTAAGIVHAVDYRLISQLEI
jgi:hypothetical protein